MKKHLTAILLLLASIGFAFAGGPAIPPSASSVSGLGTMAVVDSPVPVANGGTGATTAAAGLAALGGASLNGSSTVDFSAQNLTSATRYKPTSGVDLRAYQNDGVLADNDTFIVASFSAATYDKSSSLDISTGNITITEDGIYLFTLGGVVSAPSNPGHMYFQIADNPVTTSFFDATAAFKAGTNGIPTSTGIVRLAPGVYNVRIKQVSGGVEIIRVFDLRVTQLSRY